MKIVGNIPILFAAITSFVSIKTTAYLPNGASKYILVKVGDEVETVVLSLDRDERKMSLGIKQLTNDPWTDITSKYPKGSKHTGLIRNFTSMNKLDPNFMFAYERKRRFVQYT